MKTVKPLRLSVLTRPFLQGKNQCLALTVIAMASLDGAPMLVPEPELWKTVGDELGPDAVFDLGVPKIRPEFLVTGNAYTHHQQDKRQCAVEASVGTQRKSLLVFGERYWLSDRATQPRPFEVMRLDWQHAYGGEGHAENPVGIGHAMETIEGLNVRRLPNIEHPADRLRRPGQPPRQPAGLGPIAVERPSRMKKMGQRYDEHWKNNLFPGFAQDMDWHFFNAAPDDQWCPREAALAGAPYALQNMHPVHPMLTGHLPDWCARGFIVREAPGRRLEDGVFEEVPLALSTAWFFPHLQRVALIYHGFTSIAQDDAADVSHVMAALDIADASARKPLAHYRQVLAQRCDPEIGALCMLRDDELLPADAMAPWLDRIEDSAASEPFSRNMKARADRVRAAMQEEITKAGGDASKYVLPENPDMQVPTLHELPAFVEKMKRFEVAQRQKIEAARETTAKAARDNAVHSKQAGFDTSEFPERAANTRGKGPPVFDAETVLKGLSGVAAATGSAPLSAQKEVEMQTVARRGAQGLTQLYRMMAQHQDAADAMPSERAARTRGEVERILVGSRDFSDMDLTGADLSGMDLRGARLHRTLLESANLTDARFDGADLTEAVLVRTRLMRTSLCEAILDRANLSRARCEAANFSSARLHGTTLEKLEARDCVFVAVVMDSANLMGVQLERCNFADARLNYVIAVQDVVLRDCRFDGASLHKLTLIGCRVERLGFSGAQLDSCVWVNVNADSGVDFSGCSMRTTCFVGEKSTLRHANFSRATLTECSLRGIPLDHANFSQAVLRGSDFSGCSMHAANLNGADAPQSMFVRTDLTGAVLSDTDLSQAILQKAILVAADFRRANLFRTDVSQSLVSENTLLEGAYTEQIKTVPKRREDPVS